jgi:hypothetical protein
MKYLIQIITKYKMQKYLKMPINFENHRHFENLSKEIFNSFNFQKNKNEQKYEFFDNPFERSGQALVGIQADSSLQKYFI